MNSPVNACLGTALACLVMAGLPSTLRAQQACSHQIEAERESEFTVRVTVTNPCTASEIVRFRHNDQELSRFADDQGRVSLFRLLEEGGNRITLLGEDGDVLVFSDAGNTEPPPVEAAPSPSVPEPAPEESPAGATDAEPACGPVRTSHGFDGPLLVLAIQSDCSTERAIRVDLREQGWRFYGTVSRETPLEIELVPVDPAITLDIGVEGEGYQTLSLTSKDTHAIALLIWDDPVDLDLLIREPGQDPSRNPKAGQLLLLDDGSHTGTKIEAYTLAADAFEAGTLIGLWADFKSRGALAEGDYCGDGQYAAPQYRLLWRTGGKLAQRRFRLAALPCGTGLDEAARLVRSAEFRLQ